MSNFVIDRELLSLSLDYELYFCGLKFIFLLNHHQTIKFDFSLFTRVYHNNATLLRIEYGSNCNGYSFYAKRHRSNILFGVVTCELMLYDCGYRGGNGMMMGFVWTLVPENIWGHRPPLSLFLWTIWGWHALGDLNYFGWTFSLALHNSGSVCLHWLCRFDGF